MRVERLSVRRDKDRYPRVEARISVAGLVIALVAAGLAYVAYDSAHRDWQLKATADIISEWSKGSPVNAPHCFKFAKAFNDPKKLGLMVMRQETPYDEGQEPSLLACLSDQKENVINALVEKSQRKLTPRGDAFVGKRLNQALDADSVVATLISERIGNSDILNSRIGYIICRDDVELVRMLQQVPERENSYRAILQFANLQAPLGCH